LPAVRRGVVTPPLFSDLYIEQPPSGCKALD